MLQKEINKENAEINDRAYEIYKEHGFKNGYEFSNWIEAEKLLSREALSDRHQQTKSILFTIVGILGVIVVILLVGLFKQAPQTELSAMSLAKLKVMTVVLDPKDNEQVVVLGDTHFDFGESVLSLEAKGQLNKDVRVLKENPQTEVRMAGYTSAMGSKEVNQKLSEDRANAVRDYLVEEGIAPDRITVVGYGRTRPAVYEVTPGDVDSKQAQANMRVLFEIVVK